MEVHDEFVPEDVFGEFVERMPQVCVELVLETPDGVLLAHRTNEPVEGEWFWPGSRLFKGERLEAAARRVGREELGIDVELDGRLGVYEHFWDVSSVEGATSRHTVNVVFLARPAEPEFEISLDDQHDDYRFASEIAPWMHEYVRRYLVDAGYGDGEVALENVE